MSVGTFSVMDNHLHLTRALDPRHGQKLVRRGSRPPLGATPSPPRQVPPAAARPPVLGQAAPQGGTDNTVPVVKSIVVRPASAEMQEGWPIAVYGDPKGYGGNEAPPLVEAQNKRFIDSATAYLEARRSMASYIVRFTADSSVRLTTTPYVESAMDSFAFPMDNMFTVAVFDNLVPLGNVLVPRGLVMNVQLDADDIKTAIDHAQQAATYFVSMLSCVCNAAVAETKAFMGVRCYTRRDGTRVSGICIRCEHPLDDTAFERRLLRRGAGQKIQRVHGEQQHLG